MRYQPNLRLRKDRSASLHVTIVSIIIRVASREKSPRDTNFRIPLLSRVNERKVMKRHEESGDHHFPKCPRTDLFGYARRPLGERNYGLVRDYRSSTSMDQETRRGYRRTYR